MMQANKSLAPKLESISELLDADLYLSDESKNEVKMRAKYLVSLAG